jgi:hypothetical protein
MNKIEEFTKSDVVPAVVEAGLPITSLPAFLTALSAGNVKALQAVPGVSPAAIQAGAVAFKGAWAKTFRIVWLATLAFGLLAVAASFFTSNIDNRLSHDVIRRLEGSKKTEDTEAASKNIEE